MRPNIIKRLLCDREARFGSGLHWPQQAQNTIPAAFASHSYGLSANIFLRRSSLFGSGIIQTEMEKNLKNTQERRSFFRVDLIRRVRYKISGFTSIDCFTQNISEGGLCLLLGEELFPGMSIRIEFFLPIKKPKLIKVEAVVVWQKDYLTGAKFVF